MFAFKRSSILFFMLISLCLLNCNIVLADVVEDSDMVYNVKESYFNSNDELIVNLSYNGEEENPNATLIVAAYLEDETLADLKMFEINGTDISGLNYNKTEGHIVKLYIWNGLDMMNPLGMAADLGDEPTPTTAPTPTIDPSLDYGIITKNADGSITLTFGENSIIQGNGKIVNDGPNGTMRTDSLKPSGDPSKAILYLPIVEDLAGYDTVTVNMSNGSKEGNTINYSIFVGETEIAFESEINTGLNDWSPKNRVLNFDAATAKGRVIIEATVNNAGAYAGNYYSVTFSKDNSVPTPTIDPNKPTPTPMPEMKILVAKDGTGDFTTISEAISSIKVAPTSEDQRVTIEVMEGVYREQLVIDKPYITLKKSDDAKGEVNVTWYYGVSYAYNNCGTNGLYDSNVDWSDERTWSGYNEEDAKFTPYKTGDKVSKISYYGKDGVLYENQSVAGDFLGGPQNWGPTIMANRYSNDFITEGIYYSNSFNMYICQEELDAGVIPCEGNGNPSRQILSVCPDMENTIEIVVNEFDPDKSYNAGESAYLLRAYQVKLKDSDKQKISYKERAAAMNLNGNSRVTVKNCVIRGNQDTLYAGGLSSYFESCDIYGGTDYIFGGAASVFNKCNLYFQGSPDTDGGGVITANSTDKSNPYGYLFMNCTIKNARDNTKNGTYGRPWGSVGGPQVTFYNCEIEKNSKGDSSISDAAWQGMGCGADEARFYEYGTIFTDGTQVDVSKRIENVVAPFGTVVDSWQILEFNPRNYLNGWDPMKFGETYLTKVDDAIADVNIVIPEGTETEIELPTAPEGVSFHWVSQSTNASVSDDGTKVRVMRPAFGEAPIESQIVLYAVDNENGFGDNKEIPVVISATTDKENVYTAKIDIEEQVYSNTETKYVVKFLSGGALIKQEMIVIDPKETKASAEILIPTGTFDVEIDCINYVITTPEDGRLTITGEKGDVVNIPVYAQKIVDDTVELDLAYESGSKTTMEYYELIELAKESGASSDIDTSDIITVNYTLDLMSSLNSYAYIDMLYGEPSATCKLDGVNSRFILSKLNSSWNQLDMVDSAQKFSGSSNGPDQNLNICGKFNYSTLSNVNTTINYKEKLMSVTGFGTNSAATFNFATFPQEYAKGKLNLAIYPTDNDNLNNFIIKDISVTYKKIVTENPPEIVNDTLLKFPAEIILDGRDNTDSKVYTFADGIDGNIRAIFGDGENVNQISTDLTKDFKNFIGNSGRADSTDPYVSGVNLPVGSYTLFVLGAANNEEINMELSDGVNETIAAKALKGSATPFDQTNKLILHTLKFENKVALENATIKLTSTASTWLPDMYAFIVVSDEILQQ